MAEDSKDWNTLEMAWEYWSDKNEKHKRGNCESSEKKRWPRMANIKTDWAFNKTQKRFHDAQNETHCLALTRSNRWKLTAQKFENVQPDFFTFKTFVFNHQ